MKPQFKTDENLPTEVLEVLRTAGFDAISAVDQGLGGAVDPDISQVCKREGRALLTLDVDFADIRAYPPEDYPGVVVLRLARQDKHTILNAVSRIVQHLRTLPLQGQLWIVEESRIRARGPEPTA